jgi:four helix bundle protein
MATFQTFEQIEVWQKARALTTKIYKITSQGSFSRDFGLRNQIREASVSMMSNTAEGFERNGTGEFSQFLSVAKGSAGEVRSELYVALDQRYISDNVFSELSTDALEIGCMIGALMSYLRSSGLRGTKFKKR